MSKGKAPELRLVKEGFGGAKPIGDIDPAAVVRSTLKDTRLSCFAMQRLLEAKKRNDLLDLIQNQVCEGQTFDFPRREKEDLFCELYHAGFHFCDRYQLFGDFSEREEMYLGRMTFPQFTVSSSELNPGRFYGVIIDARNGRPACYRLHIGLLGKRDGRYFIKSGAREVFLEDGMALLARDLYPDAPKPPGGGNAAPVDLEEEFVAAA